jgi:hypothetical protein
VKPSGSAIPLAVVPERPQAGQAVGGADCTEFAAAEEAGKSCSNRALVCEQITGAAIPSQTASVVARPACARPMTMPKRSSRPPSRRATVVVQLRLLHREGPVLQTIPEADEPLVRAQDAAKGPAQAKS